MYLAFNMLDVPSQLLQPLYIDTNISYDLDMSLFPGLDDPQHMYQPALLIATDWSDYVYHDVQDNVYDDHLTKDVASDSSPETNDSDLLPSTVSPDLVSYVDPETMKHLIDDVTQDTSSSCDCFYFLGACSESTSASTELSASSASVSDCVDVSTQSPVSRVEVGHTHSVLPPINQCVRGRKRHRSREFTTTDSIKKFKMADVAPEMCSPQVCLGSVCPVMKQTVLDRGL